MVISYVLSQKNEKSNNLKVFWRKKTRGSIKHGYQNWLWSPMLERDVNLSFINKCIISVVFLCFLFLRLVYLMLPGSLDFIFQISPSVFSNVYLGTVNSNNKYTSIL